LKERAMSALAKRRVQQVEVSVLRPDSAMWEEQQRRGTARDDAIHLLMERIDNLQQQVTALQQNQTNDVAKATDTTINSTHKGK